MKIDIIRAARTEDTAFTSVLISMDSRIKRLVGQAAARMPTGQYAFYADEFTQVARLAVWDAVQRYTEDSVEGFQRFAYVTIDGCLKDAVRGERHQTTGVNSDAMKVFSAMIIATDGDVYEAEKLAQTVPPKGRRLSRDRAHAARLAWQGAASLSMPIGGEASGMTLGDTVKVSDSHAAHAQRVGHGAAMEALSVLQRYSSARDVLRYLPVTVADVDVIESTVTTSKDRRTTRYIIDAVSILRSYVSFSDEASVPDDLLDVSEASYAARAQKIARVRSCLDSMGDKQREVLMNSFGINGAQDFGWGDSGDLAGLASELGVSPVVARDRRVHARRAFAAKYIAAVEWDNPVRAGELREAAAQSLSGGGRK